MPARSPRFSPNETTSAPPLRATLAVASVEPSSMTSRSASGSASRASASTPGSELSSFQAGMKTIVPGTAPRPYASARSAPGRRDRVLALRDERLDVGGGRRQAVVDARGLRDLADDLEHPLGARGGGLGLGAELALLCLGLVLLGLRLLLGVGRAL